MTKLQVLQGLATFAMSCEANGVEFFYSYNPNANTAYVHIYEGGIRTGENSIESKDNICFDDDNFSDQFKEIIETVIDKYYKKG